MKQRDHLHGDEPTGDDTVIDTKPEQVEQKELRIETVDTKDMPSYMQGHLVLGKLVIEKIDLQRYILGRATDEALNVSVAKFWGPHINDPR